MQHMRFISKKVFFSFTVVFAFIAAYVAFAWTEPVSSPPTGNVPSPINTSSATQTKAGGLNVQGSVGIGRTSPSAKLDVLLDSSSGGEVFGQKIQVNSTDTTGNLFGQRVSISHSGPGGNIDAVISDIEQTGFGGHLNNLFGQQIRLAGTGGTVNTVLGTHANVDGSGYNAMEVYGGAFEAKAGNAPFTIGVLASAKSNAIVSGVTTQNYGLYAEATGVVNENYAVYADASLGTTANYGIYSAAGTNYFSGNVGIGTTGPSYKLQVDGSDTGTSGLQFRLRNTSSATRNLSQIVTDSANGVVVGLMTSDQLGTGVMGRPGVYYGSVTNSPVGLITNNTEKVTILGSGNVGIGTTGPNAKLEVNGGVRMNTTDTKPACDDSNRGMLWFTNGGASNDSLEICMKIGGSSSWRNL